MELHILDLTNIQVNFDLDNSKLKKIIIQERGEKLSLNVSMADHYPAVRYADGAPVGNQFLDTILADIRKTRLRYSLKD